MPSTTSISIRIVVLIRLAALLRFEPFALFNLHSLPVRYFLVGLVQIDPRYVVRVFLFDIRGDVVLTAENLDETQAQVYFSPGFLQPLNSTCWTQVYSWPIFSSFPRRYTLAHLVSLQAWIEIIIASFRLGNSVNQDCSFFWI